MRKDDIVYTIDESYYIEIRIRKCHNKFRLRLFNEDKEMIGEICCTQSEYSKSMEELIEVANLGF